VHFVTHSLGGNTVRLLMLLMRERHEALQPSLPTKCIRSLTCISSPFNGAPSVYGLGGDLLGTPQVRWGSPGFILSLGIGAIEGGRAVLRLPDVGIGLGHWFLQGAMLSPLFALVRFLWLLVLFALPSPFGASDRARLSAGFGVFSRADNLAFDAQVSMRFTNSPVHLNK
jgi:hypothetical protein